MMRDDFRVHPACVFLFVLVLMLVIVIVIVLDVRAIGSLP